MMNQRLVPPPSPDLSPCYDSKFAMLLWRLIGYRQPLIDRLRDHTISKTPAELDFVADVLDGTGPKHRGKHASVTASRQKLGIAATFLEYRFARRYLWKNAVLDTAKDWRVSKRTVLANKKWAEELGGGEWWRAAKRLADKGVSREEKIQSLRCTW